MWVITDVRLQRRLRTCLEWLKVRPSVVCLSVTLVSTPKRLRGAQGRLTSTPTMGGRSTPHIWHGEAQFSLFGPNMKARFYSLTLHDLDTLKRLPESPQYWAMCCLHKHTITLASNNFCLPLASLGCRMQQLSWTNNSLSKICNPKWLIRQPPLLKMWEIALPIPLRIDAPGCARPYERLAVFLVVWGHILQSTVQEFIPNESVQQRHFLWKAIIWTIRRDTWKRCVIGYNLVLFSNRKSHTGLRSVPKSVTLCDLEQPTGRNYALSDTKRQLTEPSRLLL